MDEKQNLKEPYETPVVLDITPVTSNVVAGESNGEPENPDDSE